MVKEFIVWYKLLIAITGVIIIIIIMVFFKTVAYTTFLIPFFILSFHLTIIVLSWEYIRGRGKPRLPRCVVPCSKECFSVPARRVMFCPYCAWGGEFLGLASLWSTNNQWLESGQPICHCGSGAGNGRVEIGRKRINRKKGRMDNTSWKGEIHCTQAAGYCRPSCITAKPSLKRVIILAFQ